MECSKHELIVCSLDNCLVLAWSIGLVLVSRTWHMNQLSHRALDNCVECYAPSSLGTSVLHVQSGIA